MTTSKCTASIFVVLTACGGAPFELRLDAGAYDGGQVDGKAGVDAGYEADVDAASPSHNNEADADADSPDADADAFPDALADAVAAPPDAELDAKHCVTPTLVACPSSPAGHCAIPATVQTTDCSCLDTPPQCLCAYDCTCLSQYNLCKGKLQICTMLNNIPRITCQ